MEPGTPYTPGGAGPVRPGSPRRRLLKGAGLAGAVGVAGALLRSTDASAQSSTFGNLQIIEPSGDTTGAKDATAINDALTAQNTPLLTPGTWYLNATIGPMVTGQWIVCAPEVVVNWLGTGPCFQWSDGNGAPISRATASGGIVGRPIIDGIGAGSTGASYGIQVNSIQAFQAEADIRNFTVSGSIGLYMLNENYFSEQCVVDVFCDKCATAGVFACGTEASTTCTGSFDRGDFTLKINQGDAAYNGVVFQNGAQIVGGRLRIFGNFLSSDSAVSSAVLTLTGSAQTGPDVGAPSELQFCELDINVELDGGLTGGAPRTVNFGSASNLVENCSGNVSFGSGFAFTSSNVTSQPAQWIFEGPLIGDTALDTQTVPNKLSVTANLSVPNVGNGLRVAEGTDAKQGTATLVGGTVTVSNTNVTSSSRVFIGQAVPKGTVGACFVSSMTAGTGFTIKSTSSTDISTVAYEIFEPA
jgi:hypothetical protein